MSKRLYSIISNVMDIPISEINDESSPESIESWDSFNSYVLLDELETEFKTEFVDTLEVLGLVVGRILKG